MSKEAMKLEKIMEQAQVFASAWSLVGGRFDSGNMLDEAEAAKEELRQMVAEALSEQPAQDDPDLQDKDPELVEQPAQHEPFTHYRHYDNGLQDWADEKTIPLYTSPPAQRTWVGLTDDEIERIFNNWPTYHLDHEEFARAIEAILREKNL